jgi:hypothetical protein
MSGLYENLPFARGSTFGATATTDAVHLDGKEYIHQDRYYGTGMFVRVRICRNNSGQAILPKTAVKFNLTAGKGRYDVAGSSTVTAEPSGIADEFLPTSGVPDKDLFYVVVEGPTIARTSMAGSAENVITVGDKLHALTGATTGATTAGRVYTALFTGATSVLAGQIQNVVGTALSAKTTANTNADVLINAGRF